MNDELLQQVAADLWGAFRSGLGYEVNIAPNCFGWAYDRYVKNVSKPEILAILSTVNHDMAKFTYGCMHEVGQDCRAAAESNPRDVNNEYTPYLTFEVFEKACKNKEDGEGLVCGG